MNIEEFLELSCTPRELIARKFGKPTHASYILLGETFIEEPHHRMVSEAILELCQQNVKAIYLDADVTLQPDLALYSETGDETYLQKIAKQTRTVVHNGGIITLPVTEDYLTIIKAARQHGMQIKAISTAASVSGKDHDMATNVSEQGLIYVSPWHIMQHVPTSLYSLLKSRGRTCYAIAQTNSASSIFAGRMQPYFNGAPIAFDLQVPDVRDGIDRILGHDEIELPPYRLFDGLICHPNP